GSVYVQYQKIIVENGIDGSVLHDFVAEDDNELKAFLDDLKITDKVHQRVLCKQFRTNFCGKEISPIQETTPLPPSPPPSSQEKLSLAISRLYLVRTKAFLTHAWGIHNVDHLRVSKVNKALQKRGLVTWFDEDRMIDNIL